MTSKKNKTKNQKKKQKQKTKALKDDFFSIPLFRNYNYLQVCGVFVIYICGMY